MSAGSTAKARLTFVDETRAIAIAAMILMHFGPGLIERIPALSGSAEAILVLGRFATPAFITVFGVTAGLVYGDAFAHGPNPAKSAKLLRRARTVLLAALLLAIPRYTLMADEGSFGFGSAAYATYSVLNYYVLGVATMPLWLRLLGDDPVRRAPILGIGLWLLHCLLGPLWAYDPGRGALEYARLHLFSGHYPYFAMTGVALCALPIGVWLRRARREDGGAEVWRVVRTRVVPLGLSVALLGFVWGTALDELSLQAILDATPKNPARPWYYLFFGGMALLMLGGMAWVGRRGARVARALYPLGLMGQASLEIYTAHAYVLPSLYWMDQVTQIRGLVRVAAALVLFAAFCAYALRRRHRQRRRAAAAATASSS